MQIRHEKRPMEVQTPLQPPQMGAGNLQQESGNSQIPLQPPQMGAGNLQQGSGSSQIPSQPPQMGTTNSQMQLHPPQVGGHLAAGNWELQGSNVPLQQPAQVQVVPLTSNPAFVGPSNITTSLQRFIVAALDSALTRSQASGQGKLQQVQQTSDGLKVDSQTREEDRLAWQ